MNHDPRILGDKANVKYYFLRVKKAKEIDVFTAFLAGLNTEINVIALCNISRRKCLGIEEGQAEISKLFKRRK
jgi:hypothetical protein